ncbi:hypothetical protein AK812_SmicGene28045 [Symbiodinium microadriaticum]|uniref:Uncharacterized protein n=1 Tax=Symbiodinium microadriaticum TaxID=2951 RepID=A0A1Q9D5E2_SYMMI|nr:hypothetical protein AK812_SmicGene28045 [Symbiodinium microadriaticum]
MCMRAYMSECTHAITPFHVPKTTVVFPRHPRIAQALFNHQDALKRWATRQEPTCKCDLIKKYAPKAPTFGGHVAARGIELTHCLSSLEKQRASGSVTDTFFPDKAQIRTQFVDAWSSWCRTNALPGPPRGLNVVFEQIWDKHLTHVQARETSTNFCVRQRHGAQPETTFSVNLKEQAQQLRVFRGRRRTRASREVILWCEDIPTIIRHALALQHFQVSTRNFRQCFGSPMGSPLSPALCGMVIAAQEEIWRRTFNISCSNMSRSLLGLRYVENRLWLSERRFEQLPGIRLLLNNYFYGGSIILEEEPAFEFVGFTLDFEQRRILYSRACATHDIPSTKSAAPQPVLLSGVLARAHTIKKCSHPRAQALMDLRYLWDLAEQRGYEFGLRSSCQLASHSMDQQPLPESPNARREAITRVLLEILGGEDSAGEADNSSSRSPSTPSALRDPAFRDMLADFIEKTTQDINNLQQRVRELEQRLQR